MTKISCLHDLEKIHADLINNVATVTNDCPIELSMDIPTLLRLDLTENTKIIEKLALINTVTTRNLIIKIIFPARCYTPAEQDMIGSNWGLIHELKLQEKIEVSIEPAPTNASIPEYERDYFFTMAEFVTHLSITNMPINGFLNEYIKSIKLHAKQLKKISITNITVGSNNFYYYRQDIANLFVNLNSLLIANTSIKQCIVEFANQELFYEFLQSNQYFKDIEQPLRETIKLRMTTPEKLAETLNEIGEITTSILQLEEKFPKEELRLKTLTVQNKINNLVSDLTTDLKARTIDFFEDAKLLEQQGNKNVYYYIAQYHANYGDTQDYKKIFENLKKVTQQDIMYGKANEQIMHLCMDTGQYTAIFAPQHNISETGEIILSPEAKKEQQKNILKFAFYARKELGVDCLNNIFKEYCGIAFGANMENIFTNVDFTTTDESLFEDLVFSIVTFAANCTQAAIASVVTNNTGANIINFSNRNIPKIASPSHPDTTETQATRKRSRSPSPN